MGLLVDLDLRARPLNLHDRLTKKKHNRQHFAGITALLLSGDSRFLFSASRDASIRRWEIRDGEAAPPPLPSPAPSAAPSPPLCPSPSPAVSASFSASFAGHGDWVTSLAMPHPHVLASASYDRTVRLWDARAAAGGEGGYGDGEGGGGDGDDGGDRRRASSSHSASSSPKTDLPPLATLVGHSDYVTCLASLGAVASGAGAGAGAGGGGGGGGGIRDWSSLSGSSGMDGNSWVS